MRLGGPVFSDATKTDDYVKQARADGYRAVYYQAPTDLPEDTHRAISLELARADLVIAEVGSWSNPIDPDPEKRTKALNHCRRMLALGEVVGARCCVNISGSRGPVWDGPDARNLTGDTFDLVVETVRSIIDDVRPTRTAYTLETMPWMYPDSADSYLALIAAVDRPMFAAHFDPVNLVCSPQLYFRNGEMIADFIAKLGPHIRSVHCKDTRIAERLTVKIEEVRPGLGALDHARLLRELSKLDPDLPVMLEHLPDHDEYLAAAAHLRGV
ncbi:MAG: sugar phosphate isomerase/epimerase, partial [Planctomycetes bacterium]|nr:sugar phosphate isomerase/epimerase [Planctomycetota bacterium]